jgi:hypothetical protein
MIPRSALLLGLAGLLPFVACALTGFVSGPSLLAGWEDIIALRYGIIILAFMSGVLWGFATKASGRKASIGYALSVLPALWAFFTTMGPTPQALSALIAGFVGILLLDYYFWRSGLAPEWWMRLRLLVSAGVLASLLLTLYL